jgi:DNA repair protein RecO (recombination protein O)
MELGEADRLTTVYSLQKGKLRLVAKGVRKPRSRKAGHLEPFTRVSLLVARGRQLDIITQAEAIETYPGLRRDLHTLGRASYVAELMDRFTVEEGIENRSLYRTLLATLERLSAPDARAQASMLYFELRLLDYAGFRPELFRCLGCGEDVRPEDQFFSFHEGGVLCPNCGPGDHDGEPISLPALKVLRHYQRNRYAEAAAPRVRDRVYEEIEGVLEGYLTYLLERRLNVPRFLRELDRGPYMPEST